MQNERLKRLGALRTEKGRREQGRYLVEGVRALSALPKGITPLELFVKEGDERLLAFAAGLGVEPTLLPEALLERACPTEHPSGIAATFALPEPKPFAGRKLVVLDNISDPGNLGTIVRTAVATEVKDFLLISSASPYQPKAVRASMGGNFLANFRSVTDPEGALDALEGYTLALLDMKGENIFRYTPPSSAPFALAVGSEAHGSSDFLRARADVTLSLPMKGDMESLNAAVAASVALIVLGNRED